MLEEAVELYRQALDLDKPKKKTYIIHNNLGTAYFYLENFEQAIEAYRRAGNLRSGSYPNINFGLALSAAKKHDRAIAHYETYLETHEADPERKADSASVYYSMGNALIEKMQSEFDKPECAGQASEALCEQAMESFSNSVARNPDHGDAYNNWGVVLKWMGRHDQAIDKFARGYAVSPPAMSETICGNIEAAIVARKIEKGENFAIFASRVEDQKRKRKAFDEINLSVQCEANWQLQ